MFANTHAKEAHSEDLKVPWGWKEPVEGYEVAIHNHHPHQ